MDMNRKQVVDELAIAIFTVMKRNGQLKPPAAIGVFQGMSDGPRRTATRSETVWEDYRPEARQIFRD